MGAPEQRLWPSVSQNQNKVCGAQEQQLRAPEQPLSAQEQRLGSRTASVAVNSRAAPEVPKRGLQFQNSACRM